MDERDALVHLDQQLEELEALARLLDDSTTALRSARLHLLLAAVNALAEQEPGRIPAQRVR